MCWPLNWIFRQYHYYLFADDEAEGDLKDLIDDNPIEESDGDDSDGSEGSKKRKKSDDEDELDDRLEDEDYDLLEENLGVRLERKVSVVSFGSCQPNKTSQFCTNLLEIFSQGY